MSCLRLNRTFYGIETNLSLFVCRAWRVLIVPFMELKPFLEGETKTIVLRLNRTFYGIETDEQGGRRLMSPLS